MIQLIFKFLTIFCAFGGAWIGSFFAPLFPGLLVSCFVPSMLVLMLAFQNNSFNSSEGQKDWRKGSAWAFLFYYIIMLSCACSVLHTSCEVRGGIPI